MTFKSILVHLNDRNNIDNLLQVAIGLASASQAHLTGLFVLPPVVMPAMPELTFGDDILSAHRTAWRVESDKAQAKFDGVVKNQAFVSQWDCVDAGAQASASVVSQRARTADLVIVSRDEPGGNTSSSITVERTILESGRPVMIVPTSSVPAQLGKRVLLAWNGRKEVARAAFDALPLLKSADIVHVVTIDAARETASDQVPGADIAAALSRHGVQCEAVRFTQEDLAVGDTLLNYVSDHNIDVVVMGCYGHTRLREFVFGGASRRMLEHTTVPVLMSH